MQKPDKRGREGPAAAESLDAEYHRKVLSALDRLAMLEGSPRKVDLSLVNLSMSDMVGLSFKMFIASLPLAITLFALSYMLM